jgi:hypothetical protein
MQKGGSILAAGARVTFRGRVNEAPPRPSLPKAATQRERARPECQSARPKSTSAAPYNAKAAS